MLKEKINVPIVINAVTHTEDIIEIIRIEGHILKY